MTFASAVFGLCFLTSTLCAALLYRAHRRKPMRLLLLSAICFAFLAINNFLVILDILVFPDISFLMYRHIAALAALAVLLFGFIWESP